MGREDKIKNDLFYVCSLIEFLGRKTKNKREYIVVAMGKEIITHYFELADVYHCEPLEKTAAEIQEKVIIENGNFDNVAHCNYKVPTVFDIGKVYKRLIFSVSQYYKIELIDALMQVYTSWITAAINNYNSSMYYENPNFIFYSYLDGDVLKE